MEYDVRTFREPNGRWHWEMIGPFPRPVGAGGVKEGCCNQPSEGGACKGFSDEQAAKNDGWRRAKELEGKA